MSEKPTAEDIKRLDERATQLSRDLDQARTDLRLATLAYWGCQVGDAVRQTRGRTSRTGSIASVKYASGSVSGKPWVNVRLHKKDGTPGERIVSFYSDWEPVAEPAAASA